MNDTKEHILKTACRLFINKSYKAVTMSELEKETGLTKGAFYHYFRNKEEIYEDVIDKFYLNNREPSCDLMDKTDTLKQFIELHMNHIKLVADKFREITGSVSPDPTTVSLIIEAKEYCTGFKEKLKSLEDSSFNRWENIISLAKDKGEIRPDIDSDILAENFIAIGQSIFRYVLNNRSLDYALSMVNLQYSQLYRLAAK